MPNFSDSYGQAECDSTSFCAEFLHVTRLRDRRGMETIIAIRRSYYHVRRKNGIILAKGVTIFPSPFRLTDHSSGQLFHEYVSIATRIDFLERSEIRPVIFYVTSRRVSFYSNSLNRLIRGYL